jgi:ribosomal-protein-alanine N-acetyltransferase
MQGMERSRTAAAGMPASIQQASWRDLNAVRRLEQICFPRDMWPLWDIIGVLSLPNIVRLKANVNGELVGFIACDIRRVQRVAWVATVGVLPEYRGRGIGAALLLESERQARMPYMRLNVRVSNRHAIHLYRSLGYQEAGTWAAYYHDGEDALVMEKRARY